MIRFSDVAISVSSTFMIHAHCALMAILSSLLWCSGSHRNHRGQNQRSNHIAQPSDPFLLQLSISAWLTARYHDHRNYLSTTERDRVHFLLFCSIWTTFLSPIFPVLLILERVQIMAGIAAHAILCVISAILRPVIPLIAISCSLFLSWVFWLSGAAAITESLGGGLDCQYVASAYIHIPSGLGTHVTKVSASFIAVSLTLLRHLHGLNGEDSPQKNSDVHHTSFVGLF